MSSQIRLRIVPSVRCLFDQLVQVKVEGLAPHRSVELQSKLVDDRGVVFKARARYRADQSGQVDVSHSPSLGGSYSGVEPMGWLWSMTPETPHSKLLKKTALTPTLVQLEALSAETGEVLAQETNHRDFMTEGMKRVPVKDGRIRGVLFIPPGEGPFPGIVDMYTLGGGLCEPRASLLANKGFVVLALAFYGYQDLPKKIQHLDLEYFEEAVTYLRARPEVRGPGVGVVSLSQSGALAMAMSSFLPDISATVCINSCNANTVFPLRYKDLVVPPLMPVLSNITIADDGLLDIRDGLPDTSLEENRASLIPVERAAGHFLFVFSDADRNWNSGLFGRQAAERLRSHGKDNFQLVPYDQAGHFLEYPHLPCCSSAMHAAVGSVVRFGGEPKAHHEAQLDLWGRMENFFRKHLSVKSQL